MSVTESFANLKAQVEEANTKILAAAEQSQAEIQTKADEAREVADNHAAALRAKSSAATSDGESYWEQMQADWNRHRERMRQQVDTAKKALDADAAARDAEDAVADAENAIAFAQSAAAEAERATLAAMWTLKQAQSEVASA
jgi:hypothetical protein